jgi:DNA-binding transcriptional LysR family regulator
MDLRQLKTFRMVATTLSFTRAAETLDYAQSSVTAQVRGLEDELGVRLFDRLGRRVALTEAGTRLLAYADKMLDLADEAARALAENEEPSGSLIIAAPETLSAYRLPPLLKQFRQRFPRVQIILRSASMSEALAQLGDGSIDVAIMLTEPLPDTGAVVSRVLVEERLLVLAAPEHPLNERERVEAEALRDATMLLTESGCSYRTAFENRLLAAGVRLNMTMEFGSVEAIKQCVMANLGLTLLPEIAVYGEIQSGRLRVLPLAEAGFVMHTCLMWHKDKWLSPALAEFIRLCEQVLAPASQEPITRSLHTS